jgi:site-specific DNA recombinase
MNKRAVLYLRVSTSRQAEKDLSIPDQRRQAEAHCKAKGWEIVGEYVEAGASATDDRRPAFQQMLAEGLKPHKPFDVVVVHSFSRFFRDAYKFEYHRRKLDKAGIGIISITQEIGEDPMGDMVRQILTLFDEYQSKENAKHVLRAMKENARQGYWNGGPTPFGYKAVAAETKGDTVKKKLVIDPTEAEIVKEIFRLHKEGDGVQGPMGIRSIIDHLNSKGITYRKGRLFSSSVVHAILTRTAYKGVHHFNRKDSRTRTIKDRSEWIPFESPVIIPPAQFDATQAKLKKRRPTVTPPRETTSPTLLTGLAKCASGSGMTLRTGKGGRYRYYACHKHMNKGGCDCSRKSIPMDQLDTLVLDQLETHLFQPERLEEILESLLDRTRKSLTKAKSRSRDLNKQEREINTKLDRLYNALAEGTVTQTEAFRRKVSTLEAQRDEVIQTRSQLTQHSTLPTKALAKSNLKKFSDAMHEKLRADDPAFRKAYVRLFVDEVTVSDEEIRISGPKAALTHAISSKEISTSKGVPSFDREWWTRHPPHYCF